MEKKINSRRKFLQNTVAATGSFGLLLPGFTGATSKKIPQIKRR
jgi:hypothetical protein